LTTEERNHKILGGGARLQQFTGAGKLIDFVDRQWLKSARTLIADGT
jgi:hypothetical protein